MRICFVLYTIIMMLSCDWIDPPFQKVGDFGNQALQYYTFNINKRIDSTHGLAPELLEKIKEHGRIQVQQKGQITTSFYYTGNAPDFTGARGGLDASTMTLEAKPLVAIEVQADGKVVVIKYPG